MESLLLHEAVRAITCRRRARGNYETCRRFGAISGSRRFGEGWALYAEGLGYEMGFYKAKSGLS